MDPQAVSDGNDAPSVLTLPSFSSKRDNATQVVANVSISPKVVEPGQQSAYPMEEEVDWDTLGKSEVHEKQEDAQAPIDKGFLRQRLQRG